VKHPLRHKLLEKLPQKFCDERTQKESDRERQIQIVAESVKIEQLAKIDFSEDLLLLK
jgi:hypothetical protein